MALNAYTIYGAPLIQRKQSNDALDVQVISNPDEPWLSQPMRAPNQAKTRFVPAQGEYDDKGILRGPGETLIAPSVKDTTPREVGSWYTSLPRLHKDAPRVSSTSKNTPKSVSAASSTPNSRASSAPVSSGTVIPSKPRHGADWFKSPPKDLNQESIATSTLADMLRRDPPNVSHPHTPPVYYGIGPRNKGYEMLSKSGWEEGQPLGPRASVGGAGSSRRRASPKQGASHASEPTKPKEKKEKWMVLDSSLPKLLLPRGEGTTGQVDVIDLTVSNEEEREDSSEEEEEEEEDAEMFSRPNGEEEGDGSSSGTDSEEGDHRQPTPSTKQFKAILTPIPVALKHDRKGLGLSKSKKLVTHSSLALRHHIQHGALDRRQHILEMRRMERERLRGEFGRGKNAFARKAKEEQRRRDRLMEYMGS